MRLQFTYDNHHNAGHAWEEVELKEWITDVFEAPGIEIRRGCSSDIRRHVETEFMNEGWPIGVSIDQNVNLKVFSIKDELGFQLQTGNMSRAPYDLLKMQYLFQSRKISAAAIALPTVEAARKMGDNIANADRVIRELQLFDRVITAPILVIGFG